MTNTLVDAKGLAKHLNVNVEIIKAWTRERRIPCIRATKFCVRYRLEEVEDALRQPARTVGGCNAY